MDSEQRRSRLGRLGATAAELDAAELLEDALKQGATPVADCPDCGQVVLSGTLSSVTLRPRSGVPALEAELFDGSGRARLVWLGRRRIAGIAPGRSLRAYGRITRDRHERVMFNPAYELRP
jgi:hypothetical protein